MATETVIWQDCGTEMHKITVYNEHGSLSAIKESVHNALENANPFFRVRDDRTGDIHFVHSMKVADVVVKEVEE